MKEPKSSKTTINAKVIPVCRIGKMPMLLSRKLCEKLPVPTLVLNDVTPTPSPIAIDSSDVRTYDSSNPQPFKVENIILTGILNENPKESREETNPIEIQKN